MTSRNFCLAFGANLILGIIIATSFRDRNAAFSSFDALETKQRHYFWASTGIDEVGVPVDLVGQPKLLARLYPGYDIAGDGDFWDLFFRADFGPDSFVPELGANVKVSIPWTGCFLLAQRYGADVLVFGNSETSRGIIPGLLADRLTGIGQPLKVLMCATNGLPLTMIPEAVDEMVPIHGGKAKLAIFGYSFWQAYARSKGQKNFLVGKRSELINHHIRTHAVFSSISGIQSRSLAKWFPPLSWDSLFLPRWLAAKPNSSSPGEGVEVPAGWAQDEPRLAGAARSSKATYSMLEGSVGSDCDDPDAAAELDAAIASLQQVADRVLIYLTPTTDLQKQSAPTCLEETARRLLQRRAGPTVTVLTEGWRDYGLDYRDFLWSTGRPDRLRIDLNHTNQKGAERVTLRLAKAARPWMGAPR